jgi:hypothetical protein
MALVRLDRLQQFAVVDLRLDPGHDPSSVTIPQCMEVRWFYQLDDGKTGRIITHASYAGSYPGSVTLANSLFTDLSTSGPYALLNIYFNTQGSWAGIELRDLNAANQGIIQSDAPAIAGNGTGSPLPDEVAAVATLRTALTGQQNRGRMYFPNWNTLALGAGNTIAPDAVNSLQSFINNIPVHYTANGIEMAIGHFHRLSYTGSTGRVHPERPAGTVPVTQIVVRDNHWDTQRRRGRR